MYSDLNFFHRSLLSIVIPAMVDYSVVLGGGSGNLSVEIVDDETGDTVATSNKRMGSITVSNPKLWWPYSMSKQNFTNMYTLKVCL